MSRKSHRLVPRHRARVALSTASAVLVTEVPKRVSEPSGEDVSRERQRRDKQSAVESRHEQEQGRRADERHEEVTPGRPAYLERGHVYQALLAVQLSFLARRRSRRETRQLQKRGKLASGPHTHTLRTRTRARNSLALTRTCRGTHGVGLVVNR